MKNSFRVLATFASAALLLAHGSAIALAGPPQPPIPPSPPSSSGPTPIPDGGTSGLTLTTNMTKSDIVKLMSYYKSKGYLVNEYHAEYLSTGTVKLFHYEVIKLVSNGSRVINITVNGVHRNISVSNNVVESVK